MKMEDSKSVSVHEAVEASVREALRHCGYEEGARTLREHLTKKAMSTLVKKDGTS